MFHSSVVRCTSSSCTPFDHGQVVCINQSNIMNVHDYNNVVDVGTPPLNLSSNNWETKVVRFHGFETLPIGHNNFSPEFTCCGYQWRLSIFRRTGLLQGRVGVYLHNMTNEDVTINWALSMRNSNGKEVAYFSPTDADESRHFYALEQPGAPAEAADHWGDSNFADTSTLTDALEEGTLTIEVRMKRDEPTAPSSPMPFIPKNPITNNILKSFNVEESADVVFEVGSGNQEGGNSSKKAKTSTNLYAHRLVLKDGAPLLAELCKPSAGGGSIATVSIADVKPDIFRHMLYYVYGGKLAEEELKLNAKDIIDACDKYGVVGLKLEAEACYVKSTTTTIDNMMDNLLYADSKNCALLKEAVIDFVVKNGQDVLEKVSLKDVPGGVFADLLPAMTREKNKATSVESTGDKFTTMRVSELRRKLDEKGLDVDGSREAMIAALQESKSEC